MVKPLAGVERGCPKIGKTPALTGTRSVYGHDFMDLSGGGKVWRRIQQGVCFRPRCKSCDGKWIGCHGLWKRSCSDRSALVFAGSFLCSAAFGCPPYADAKEMGKPGYPCLGTGSYPAPVTAAGFGSGTCRDRLCGHRYLAKRKIARVGAGRKKEDCDRG